MVTASSSDSTGAIATEALSSRERYTTLPGFRLVVRSGADDGKRFVSSGALTVIGTHESADLVLTDTAVSRFHCEIDTRGDAIGIRDLGSKNGTHVDGTSVVQAHLHAGARIRLGRSEIGFELAEEPVKLALHADERFDAMVGRSAAMRRVFALLERAAENDATVLLHGETGTGKEIAAESIHRASARRGGPFIVVDCGAIPHELMESELFGSERGAFTGAVGREGLLEAASGGTVFLDEIGELDLDLQPKLLRALDKRQSKRVGGKSYAPLDVRVIAASHRDLRAEVNARRFRGDLYYRLAVIEIELPALRERLDDLPPLVGSILRGFDAIERPDAQRLRTPEFFEQLARHHWPGNVRELKNYIERCLALREALPIGSGDEPVSESFMTRPLQEAREAWNLTFERRYVEEALKRTGDNVAAAAREAGVDRAYFHRLLRRHGLR